MKSQEELTTFYCLTETNEWEGESWYHYFLDEPGVYDILSLLQENEANDFTDLETITSITWREAERLTNQDHGEYIQLHWFGKLTKPDELKQANSNALYRGGIRQFGEELFSYEPFFRRQSIRSRQRS